jgi:hypothetical protein
MSAWQPFESGEWIDPGTANTSRPWSAAVRAVISEPDGMAASTTRQPRARPLIRRLRRGKLRAAGAAPSGNSDSSSPRSAISAASAALRRGYTTSTPVPSTAMVEAAPARPPRCAAASMPAASPETMLRPASLSARAKLSALRSPCAVALRLPTMASAWRWSSSTRPCA